MTPYLLSILHGAVLVLEVALGSLAVAVLLGLAGAMAKLSGHKPAVWLATLYSTLVRGIPDLVLMLLIFYGGQIGLNWLLEAVGVEEALEAEGRGSKVCNTICFRMKNRSVQLNSAGIEDRELWGRCRSVVI